MSIIILEMCTFPNNFHQIQILFEHKTRNHFPEIDFIPITPIKQKTRQKQQKTASSETVLCFIEGDTRNRTGE